MSQTFTAWELAGDWSLTERAEIRIVGGHTLYEQATNEGGRDVRLSRLDADLRQINRYVDPETLCELVPIKPNVQD